MTNDQRHLPPQLPDCGTYALLLPVDSSHLLSEHDRARLDAHLAICPHCQAKRVIYARMDEALRRQFEARKSDAPTLGLLMNSLQPPSKRFNPANLTRDQRRIAAGATAIAAVVLIAILAQLLFGSRSTPSSTHNIVTPTTSPSALITKTGTTIPTGTKTGTTTITGTVTVTGTAASTTATPSGLPTPLSTPVASPSPGQASVSIFAIGGVPVDATFGPDGNIWFTMRGPDGIGRMTPDGVVTTFLLPQNSTPSGPTIGPDGNIWFTELRNSTVARMTPSGTLTEFPLNTQQPPSIQAVDASNHIWATEGAGTPVLLRIDLDGTVREFTIPTTGGPSNLTEGSDGNIWFEIIEGSYRYGRVTPDGVITIYDPITTNRGYIASRLVPGPNGNLWAIIDGKDIGYIRSDGSFALVAPADRPDQIDGLTYGPDGFFWYKTANGHQICKMTVSGAKSCYSLPIGDNQLYVTDLAAGPDGNLWFAPLPGQTLWSLSPSGVANSYPMGGNAQTFGRYGFFPGPGNSLWFTDDQGNIGHITAP